MNTIRKHFVLLVSFAALLAACKTEALLEELSSEGSVIHVSIPDNVSKVSMTDRTASGGGMALAWEAGDQIRVISGAVSELFTIKEGFSSHVADFTGTAVSGSVFDVIYPGSFASLAEFNGKSYAGQIQKGNGSTAHLAYHAALSGIDAYSEVAFTQDWASAHGGTLFRNGVLKIVIVLPSGMSAVTKASLLAPSDIFYLDNAGSVAVNELSVELDGVDVSSDNQVLTAYMNIPSKEVALSAGLTLSVKVTAEGGAEYSQDFTLEKDVVMQGGRICTIHLEPEVVSILDDYYVSVEGSGEMSGADAANSINLGQLKSLLRTIVIQKEDASTQEASNANAEKMDGVTFHFADGTYILPDADNPGGLKLEYSGYSKQVEITFEGSENAILSGDSKYRVLILGNQVALAVKGMKIADGARDEDSGGGVLIAAGSSGKATLKLEGTVFSNNKVSLASGGAIRCSKGELIAKDCVFESGNYARNGGSILTDNSESSVSFTNCTFKSHASNTGGASNNSKGKQSFNNCDFVGCYTEQGMGGAIHANAEGCEVSIKDCRFTSCKAISESPMSSNTRKSGGIISTELARVDIDNSVFEDCESVSSTLIYMKSGASSTAATGGFLTCNNTVFKNNRAADRGLISVNGSKSNKQAAVAFFNNCVFYGNSMRTNEWGFILHGSNPGIACFNNCTIYGNTRQTAGGNSVLLNNDGLIIFTNSTLIDSADMVAVRNTDASNDARVLLANSIVVNTSTTSSPLAYGPGGDGSSSKMKCPLFLYNNIIGPSVDDSDMTALTDEANKKDATLSTFAGGEYDASKNVFAWNGPDGSFTKMTPALFESAVKNSLNVKYKDFNAYIGDNTLGELYYAWLSEIGAVGKDALGTERGGAWWPGAYQAE